MNSTTHVPTENARRYLGQFVKHFAHKLPARLEDDLRHGEVEFPSGLCTMDADDHRLAIILNAGAAEELTRLQDVVDRHLLRFAFREALSITWENSWTTQPA